MITRKQLLSTASAAAVAVGMGLSPMPAHAVVTTTLTLTEAGASSCADGTLSGDTCTVTSVTGLPTYNGSFGTFGITADGGQAFPYKVEPQLWLNYSASSKVTGSMTITLTETGYNSPVSPFPIAEYISGTLDPGMKVVQTAYFDPNDTGVAGAGTEIGSGTWTGPAAGSGTGSGGQITADYSGSAYGLSWVVTIDSTLAGASHTAGGMNEIQSPVPEPASLSLLGGGLLAFGAWRRRKSRKAA